MNYTNHQHVPVYSNDHQPLMPTQPARARKLLAQGRAVPHHVKGLFGIRLLNRNRAESAVQPLSINIEPGAHTSGFAVTQNAEDGTRQVLALMELKHRAFAIKATLKSRSSNRRNRRGRLRHRAPRFKHRRRRTGSLPPSVDSLRTDTMRLVTTLQQIHPITGLRLERHKFDPHLLMNPNIQGTEYQEGTLHGTQLRAYIMERDNNRCVYCRRKPARLELDHVIPRAIGSGRVDNLAAACRACNQRKANRPVAEFLADNPALLREIQERLQGPNLRSAAHINSVLPSLIRDLEDTGLPLELTNAASVAWRRRQLRLEKSASYDAALQGQEFSNITSLPSKVLEITPKNGRSKQKANVDGDGTPVGLPFRQQQRLPKHLRRKNPAAGHSNQHQRHGPSLIGTGDIVRFTTKKGEVVTGRTVIKEAGARVRIRRTEGEVSASMQNCVLLARNPRWTLRRCPPSQQKHASQGERQQPEPEKSR